MRSMISAMPLMPMPPMPTKWTGPMSKGVGRRFIPPCTFKRSGCNPLHDVSETFGRIRLRHGPGRGRSADEGAGLADERHDGGGEAFGRQLALGDRHGRARFDQ